MFCYNCGKEIEDDSLYCPFCGIPQNKPIKETKKEPVKKETKPKKEEPKQEASQEPTITKEPSKSPKGLIIGILAAVVIIGVIITCVFVFNGSSVKVLQGKEVEFEGYNGYGNAYVVEDAISINIGEALQDDYQKLQEQYNKTCSLNSLLTEKCVKIEAQALAMESTIYSLDYDLTTKDGKPIDELSNGDTVTLTITYDEEQAELAGIKFKNTTRDYKVSGLENLKEIDVLQYVEAEWASSGGSFYLDIKAKEGSPIESIPCTASDPDENGDVTITIDGRKLASEYGYTVSELNKTKKIHVGQKPQTIDYLTDDNRSKIEELAIKVLSKVYASKCGYNLYSEYVDQTELIIVPSPSDITNLQVNNGRIRASFNVSTDKGNTYKKSIAFDAYIDQDGAFKYAEIETSNLSCAIKGGEWPEYE